MTLVELLCVGILSIPGLAERTSSHTCQRYVPLVVETSAKYDNIDPSLMLSIMFVESSYQRRVVSKAGACGLMQIIPKYTGRFRRDRQPYTCEQLKTPHLNISLGIRIYSGLLKMTGGDENRALCYYNAGPRGCEKIYKRRRKTREATREATKRAIDNSRYVKKVRKIQKIILSNSSDKK